MGRGGGGGGRSGGGGGAATAAQSEAPQLPAGVDVTVNGFDTVYAFETDEGNSVDVIFNGTRERSVSFEVNGSLDQSNVSESEAKLIADRIRKITKYDVAQQPDGTAYANEAWTGDGKGRQRALAYMKAGFSPPALGIPGESQYAKTQNGKLVPDLAKAGFTEASAKQARRDLLQAKN